MHRFTSSSDEACARVLGDVGVDPRGSPIAGTRRVHEFAGSDAAAGGP